MEKKKTTIRTLIILILIVILLGVLYMSTRIKNIEVTGLTRYSKEDFLEKTNLEMAHGNTLVFWGLEKLKGNNRIHFVQSYEVELVSRDSVKIYVYENEVFGAINLMGSYFFFDKDGNIVASATNKVVDVPVVTGLEFDTIVAMEKLSVPDDKVFMTVAEIVKQLKRFDISADYIDFAYDGEVSLRIQNVTVLLGKKEDYSKALTALSGVLKKAQEYGGTLDMRHYSDETPDIVLK